MNQKESRTGQSAASSQYSNGSVHQPNEENKALQRWLILDALRNGPVSTVYSHEKLGVLRPAARIYDLRRAGYVIDTLRRNRRDSADRKHNCAVYVLREDTAV